MKNLEQLITKANELYEKEAGIDVWLKTFTPLELAKLWHNTCTITENNPDGAGYDDEVYEALNILEYFD